MPIHVYVVAKAFCVVPLPSLGDQTLSQQPSPAGRSGRKIRPRDIKFQQFIRQLAGNIYHSLFLESGSERHATYAQMRQRAGDQHSSSFEHCTVAVLSPYCAFVCFARLVC